MRVRSRHYAAGGELAEFCLYLSFEILKRLSDNMVSVYRTFIII